MYDMLLYVWIGANTERTIEEAQAQRESLKTSLRETCNNIEALRLKLNKYTEKLQDARTKYNELHEEQLKIQTDMQKLKHLEDKRKELCTRKTTSEKMIEKLRQDLSEAEDQLDAAIQQLEKNKVCSS
jgi:chromosome segregation ATPase